MKNKLVLNVCLWNYLKTSKRCVKSKENFIEVPGKSGHLFKVHETKSFVAYDWWSNVRGPSVFPFVVTASRSDGHEPGWQKSKIKLRSCLKLKLEWSKELGDEMKKKK